MPRFYYPESFTIGNTVMLPENIVRHVQVLRLNVNNELTLFDGKGNEFKAILLDVGKRHAQCKILAMETISRESPLDITLVQAISSGERMDLTIQKSVELGVNRIIPIISERCVVRLSGLRADKRIQRWQDIVISACEQSGRNHVPIVMPIVSLSHYLASIDEQILPILMSLNRTQKLVDISFQAQQIHLLIGPEGGWTDNEEQSAFMAGFHAISLGKRVLRTETASLAAITAMQTLWGDF